MLPASLINASKVCSVMAHDAIREFVVCRARGRVCSHNLSDGSIITLAFILTNATEMPPRKLLVVAYDIILEYESIFHE